MSVLNKQKIMDCLFVLIGIVITSIFTYMFKTNYYGYLFYILLGLSFYASAKILGKEIYFIIIIPLIAIEINIFGEYLLLDYFNSYNLNPLKINPFTIVLLVSLFFEFIGAMVNKTLEINKIEILGIVLVSTFGITTLVFKGTSGMSILIENYMGPICFFLLMSNKKIDIKKVKKIILVFITVGVIIGIYGVFEYFSKINFMEESYYKIEWNNSTKTEGYRIKTIIGHPLNNAMFFLFIMILTQITIQDIKKKGLLLLFFMSVILLTGSRGIFMISFLVLMYSKTAFESFKSFKKEILWKIIIGALILGVLQSPLGNTYNSRLKDADDSTEARMVAIDYFVKNLNKIGLRGLGSAADVVVYSKRNAPIIIENPWIIQFYELSYFALLYLILLILIIKKVDYKYFVIILLIAGSSYNSFGVKSPVNYMLFTLLAYNHLHRLKKQIEKGLIDSRFDLLIRGEK